MIGSSANTKEKKMGKELDNRLGEDLRSAMMESLVEDSAEFIKAYNNLMKDNEDAKGLTMNLSIRLTPGANTVGIKVDTGFSKRVKHSRTFETAIDKREPGDQPKDLDFKGQRDGAAKPADEEGKE